MTVYVHVLLGDIAKAAPANIHDIETTLTPASNTATAAFGATRWVMIFNGEASAIKVAKGTTPDPTATAKSGSVTSAYMIVPAGQYSLVPLLVNATEKVIWV
jgi:hypothetical protein